MNLGGVNDLVTTVLFSSKKRGDGEGVQNCVTSFMNDPLLVSSFSP